MSELIRFADLNVQLLEAFSELKISDEKKASALSILNTLKELDLIHKECYFHCIRVGILAKQIGTALHLDEKALFYAGIFHDVGKIKISSELLGKTGQWGYEDKEEIKKHVLVGYNIIKDNFDFSAEIILLHHHFQPDPYPKNIPLCLHSYSNETQSSIINYARIIALADSYDALHRQNSFFGNMKNLSDQEIENQMKLRNPDQTHLVEYLYSLGVFNNSLEPIEAKQQFQPYQRILTQEIIQRVNTTTVI